MDRQKKLLDLLKEDTYYTQQRLADLLGVSKRTVFNELNKLNDELQQHGAELQSKPHYGVALKVNDRRLFDKYRSSPQEEITDDGSSQVRITQIAQRLLLADGPVKTDDLCEELYISQSTIKSDFRKVRSLFQEYDLNLRSSAYKGTWIEGTEKNIRKCLSHINKQARKDNAAYFNKDVKKISAIILSAFEKHSIRMPEYLFNNIVVHFYIAVLRIRSGKILETIENYKHEDDEDTAITAEIISGIEEAFSVTFPDSEFQNAVLQLKSRKAISENAVIPRDIYELIMEILDEINAMFHVNFLYDFDLVAMLAMHLSSLELRLLYDMMLDNPLLEQIRQGSLLAFEMACVAGRKLEEKYHKKISADEMAYIALHFHLAIERKQSKNRKNILIVCVTGRGSSELLAYNIRKEYGEYLGIVDTHESTDFSRVDFSRYDFVLTTVAIREKLPVPVIEIDILHLNRRQPALDRHLRSDRNSEASSLFLEELFLPDLECADKEDVIRTLCDKAVEQGYAADNFYWHVMKREELGSTSFGNRIAIPHPYRPEGDRSFVITGLLKEPVDWNGNPVQAVFLLSMKEGGDKKLRVFYKTIGHLLSDKRAVDLLLKEQDFPSLISILEQMSE